MANDNTAMVPAPGPTAMEMRQDFAALVALKSAIMRNGVDYGTIPGCGDKPALFKPGAEKILKRFMVHVADVQVEDLGTADCIRYRVRCIGQTPDGITRGVGIGECSTDEEKYRWRKTNDAEFDDTIDDRKRLKHYKNYSAKQVRTNPADLANTVLKMAKKRAMVDLALTAVAASDFFTQDVEDMDSSMRQAVDAESQSRPKDPFAPPPVEVEAEVVTPETTPYDDLVALCKREGHTKEDVIAAMKETGHSGDVNDFTAADCDEILTAIERKKGA